MSLDDWILAFHLLSAFALVGALTLFTIVIVVLSPVDRPGPALALAPLAKWGNVAVLAGVAGTIVFGVWLAISIDAYRVWDGWIVASIVLWAVGTELGRRAGLEYDRATARARELAESGSDGPDAELAALARTSKGMLLHSVSSVTVLAVLVLMIWKPGA